MPDLVPVKRALLSVSDKTGLADFAKALHTEFGVQLISTGGTAPFLRTQGLPVTDVSEVTGFPEMMDGRVKTLHPKIHGGLLALRDNPAHAASMKEHDIKPIALLCINLYPFAATIEKPGVTLEEAIENIDIGGPAMIRSASKNHEYVLVVTSPNRYEKVLGDLRKHNGSSCLQHRRKQAQSAFAHTAAYDAAIVAWLDTGGPGAVEGADADEEALGGVLAPTIHLTLERTALLRYGENPHQRGARYRVAGVASWWDELQQHGGKELSYLNLFDGDAAWRLVHELAGDAQKPAVAIIKHANPCGAAVADSLVTAYERALECDVQSAFGGVVAIGGAVTEALADAIAAGPQADVIIASSYEPAALEKLTARRKEKYSATELSRRSPTEKKIEEALKQPTQIELNPVPSAFPARASVERQPCSRGDEPAMMCRESAARSANGGEARPAQPALT